VKRIVFILWAFSFFVWAAPEPPDGNVMQLVNQGREEGQQLKADQVRVVHPPAFPEVTMVGFLAGSNDCLLGQAIVDDKLVGVAEACGIAMRSRGWEAAPGPQKIALAMQWLEEAQLGFGDTIVKEKPPGFGDRSVGFRAPETLATLSGSVRVLVWIEAPRSATATSSRRFRRTLYWFGKDGRLLRSSVVDTFEVG
jgi:hypothetical protein